MVLIRRRDNTEPLLTFKADVACFSLFLDLSEVFEVNSYLPNYKFKKRNAQGVVFQCKRSILKALSGARLYFGTNVNYPVTS